MSPPRRWASATCPRWRRRRGSACLQREVRCGELTTWGGLSAREAGEAGKSESIHASLGSGDKIEQGEIWLPFRHLSDSTLRTIGLSKPWTGRFSNDPGRSKSPALKWCLREKTRVWPPRYPPPQENGVRATRCAHPAWAWPRQVGPRGCSARTRSVNSAPHCQGAAAL